MSTPYLFIDPAKIDNGIITVDDSDDIRHIYGSLRTRPGDLVYLSDNISNKYKAVLKEISKRQAVFEITKKMTIRKRMPGITLFQCILKKNAMELAIQKTTELGISSIVPVISNRTVADISGNIDRIQRWQKISDEAAKQSKRDFKCTIKIPVALEDIDTGLFDYFFFPYEESEKDLKEAASFLKGLANARAAAYLIGPEGGLAPEEARLLKQKDALDVNLGRNILRAETAAIYFLSVIDLNIKTPE